MKRGHFVQIAANSNQISHPVLVAKEQILTREKAPGSSVVKNLQLNQANTSEPCRASTSSPCLEGTLEFHPPNRPDETFKIDGLIDSGASAIALPISLMDERGIQYKRQGRCTVQFADKEREVDRVTAEMIVKIGDEKHSVLVVGLDIHKPLFGAKLFDLFNLSLDYKNRKFLKSGSTKPLPMELRETFDSVQVQHVILNKLPLEDYLTALNDEPVKFRLKFDSVLKPGTTHRVQVTNNCAKEMDLDTKSNKHLFVDKFIKAPSQVTHSSIKSILLTNFSDDVVSLKKGTVVAHGFPCRRNH